MVAGTLRTITGVENLMANASHLSLLKKGVNAWNEWRLEHGPDQADLSGANLIRANLSGADLSEVDLSEANLRWAYLIRADLSGANLSGANLSETDLSGANLSRANLGKASMVMAHLSGAHLNHADLSGAHLVEANLSEADLTDADLRMADLDGATLFSVVLDGVNFERATVGMTLFGNVNLSSCSGLDSVEHVAPSTLGVDSIIRSKGRIPEIFLRGVGLPDEWIAYIPSLVGDGIQFFSCFISYSSLDKPFAVRLHDALQSKGIRCWLDEKQLLPGDDISRELERGIHLWDKFLLCASENSLTSWWVEDEIKTTLEKERALRKEREKPVRKLIPLNLDGYMFTDKWDLGVLANEIRSRVAADIQDWEKPTSNFAQQVDRVIKALRADEGAREKPPPSKL
jgi:TIR domain/Pentapeptide repeats (8 copies)